MSNLKMLTFEDFQRELYAVVNKFEKELPAEEWEKGKLSIQFSEVYNQYNLVNRLYIPDEKLLKRIDNYFAWYRKEIDEDAGQLMEEIAALAFRCLQGWDNLESYQSYSAQHDLVISGSSDNWYHLMQYLHLPKEGRVIVVEAKNLKGDIEDHHFTRLCSIVQNKFEILCDLGVFVSNNNISGLRNRRILRDARATQILFHAKTKKFIVVINSNDFEKLKEVGGLPRLLEAKIRDVEMASSIELEYDCEWIKINLPVHIARHFSD